MLQIWLVAAFAFLLGLAMLLYGYRIFLVLLPVWGFFAGFWLGAEIVSLIFQQGFLATFIGWGIGFALGMIFALLSYLYFNVAVALIAAAVGYALGEGLMAALGLGGGFLAMVVGVITGTIALGFAIAKNLKAYLVKLLTSISGANAIILSVLLVLGKVSLDTLRVEGNIVLPILQDSLLWLLLWAGLAVAGFVFQIRSSRTFQFKREDYEENWG